MNPSLRKVKDTISRYDMIRPGDRVITAVSGGPDSVCLLNMLHELRKELEIDQVVAHFDHGLRPDEDAFETKFVSGLAASYGLPFETIKASPGIKTGPGPLEERARHARYGFLEGVRTNLSAQRIAVGHNRNDQAETVLMRLLRGSGLSGLAGIPPIRDDIVIRPLIEITREEILAYIAGRGLKYLTDSSNYETRFLRNRLRLELLPGLTELQPRMIELLGQTSEIIRRDDAWLETESKKWFKRIAEIGTGNEVLIPIALFSQLAEALRFRIVRHALRTAGGTLRRISMRHITAVDRLTMADKPQARINLPNGLIVKKSYGTLVFTSGTGGGPKGFSYTLDMPGTYELEDLGCSVVLEEFEGVDLPDVYDFQWTAFLNADQITYPLKIRNFRVGDRFIPFGMSGHKKLKDFFIDLKIPTEDRARIPILTNNDMPVWVCGFRIDDRFKVTSGVKKFLKVSMQYADFR